MTPTKTKTSAGIETVAETVARAKAMVPPTTPPTTPPANTDATIPVASIDGSGAPLQLPTAPIPEDTAGSAKSASESYLSQLQSDSQKRLDTAQAPVTESENKIRTALGLLGKEGETRTNLEGVRGVTSIEEQMRKAEQSIARQIADIDAFDLQTITDTEQMRVNGSKRDITKGVFNAQSAEFNLQRTINRAGQAANLRATVAANLSLQGNLEAATEQVDKAMKAIYDPIRSELTMEKFFLERNDKRLDAAQSEMANIRMKGIERKFAEIDRAVSLTDSAVQSGYASGADIKKMVSLSGDPQAQAAYALSVVGQGAREMLSLEKMAKNASINASYASAAASATSRRANLMDLAIAGDPQAVRELGFDPGAPIRAQADMELDKTLSAQIDTQNDIIDKFTKVGGMTSAIKNSTGVLQNSFLSGIFPQKAPDGGLRTGLRGGFDAMADKQEFLNTMNYLLLGDGFKQFSRLKDEGVSLTPVSEVEFKAVMDSASVLNNMAEVKDGKIVGFGNIDPAVIDREIQSMIASASKVRDEKAAIKVLGYDGYIELQQLNK